MRVHLELVNSSSNKYYTVSTKMSDGNIVIGYNNIPNSIWVSWADYGRIGNGSCAHNILYQGNSQVDALFAAQEQIAKKIAKGYEIVQEEI